MSRTLLPQLRFGVSFQAGNTLGPFPAKGQKHRALMDTAWDWESGILECTNVDVLGNNMLSVNKIASLTFNKSPETQGVELKAGRGDGPVSLFIFLSGDFFYIIILFFSLKSSSLHNCGQRQDFKN